MTNGSKSPPTPTRASKPAAESPHKRRRHGYRGYPLSKQGGGVHFGRGFSGVEPLGGGAGVLPHAGILTEESTRHTDDGEEG